MVLHGQLAIRQSGDGHAAEMQEGVVGWPQAMGGTLIVSAAEHWLHGEQAGAEDLLVPIDIAEEELKRTDALADAALEMRPFVGRENLGQEVAVPRTSAPGALAGDVESDTHLTHGGLQAFIETADLGARKGVHPAKKRPVELPRHP